MDMSDVRKVLWEAYKLEEELEGHIEGKSPEASCELIFPNYWDCETEEEFLEPSGIMIYSYALGPSRRHYIHRADKYRKIDYNTWESLDIYKTAVEVIESWMSRMRAESKALDN